MRNQNIQRMGRVVSEGVYVVIDPSMERQQLFERIDRLVREPLAAVQIWDQFAGDEGENLQLIEEICLRCHTAAVPVLINNRWEYLHGTALDGIHFDTIPADYAAIRQRTGRPFLTGITCTNDLELLYWAEDNGIDYVSFCSMFPSATAGACELVDPESVRQAAHIFSGPVFLAGGIKPDNVCRLEGLPYAGIAVISGVMNNPRPDEAIRKYRRVIK